LYHGVPLLALRANSGTPKTVWYYAAAGKKPPIELPNNATA
jgi:hypothetical protein